MYKTLKRAQLMLGQMERSVTIPKQTEKTKYKHKDRKLLVIKNTRCQKLKPTLHFLCNFQKNEDNLTEFSTGLTLFVCSMMILQELVKMHSNLVSTYFQSFFKTLSFQSTVYTPIAFFSRFRKICKISLGKIRQNVFLFLGLFFFF